MVIDTRIQQGSHFSPFFRLLPQRQAGVLLNYVYILVANEQPRCLRVDELTRGFDRVILLYE